MLDKISDKFIKKDLNYNPKPVTSQSENKSEKVFQNKKNDY